MENLEQTRKGWDNFLKALPLVKEDLHLQSDEEKLMAKAHDRIKFTSCDKQRMRT